MSLGAARRSLLSLIGVPGYRGRRLWSYCVISGGDVDVVFPKRNAVSLILSTAAGYHPGPIGPGSSLTALQRRYARRGALQPVGRRLLVTSAGVVFVIHAQRVEAVGIATPGLLARHRLLVRAVILALGP